MTALVARAHAKVNLELRLLGRRPDGYHELRTIYQTLALHDTLSFRMLGGPFRLETSVAGLACDASNLVWRAADALWKAAGRRGPVRGVAIHLRKRIPMQAGLGGGSSDAATTLAALHALWRLRMPRRDVVALARTLGSDVPFFLSGGTALGLGRGEQVYPLPDIGRWQVVLVRPDFGVPTADAYAWYAAEAETAESARARVVPAVLPVPWGPGALCLANDLEGPVCRRFPAIRRLTVALRDSGADVALMAGSGSTVLGLFSSRRAAQAAAARLVRRGRFVAITRFLTRREHAAGLLGGRPPRLPGVLPIG
jgi:4-diphosphocytidyl-2-C-methyl-D-erythritol kinase